LGKETATFDGVSTEKNHLTEDLEGLKSDFKQALRQHLWPGCLASIMLF